MAEQKKGKALADNKEKSPVQIKEAQTVKPSPMKKNTEKEAQMVKSSPTKKNTEKKAPPKEEPAKEKKPKKGKKKVSAFNTLNYRDLSGTSLDPSKKLFLSFQDRLKGDEKPLKEKALDKLKAGLEQNVQTIFKGTVEGSSYVLDPKTNKRAYFVLVNSNCNTDGYQGRIVRIRLEDFVAPTCTEPQYGENFNPETASETEIYAFINSRRESEIEFCVTAIDMDNPYTGFVTGSRAMALAKRRKKYWYGRMKIKGRPNPVFLLDEGSILDARVVAVTHKGVFVEMFGLEAFIPLQELSHLFVENARSCFEVNSKVPVVVSNIKRSSNGKISMEVSHKKTIEDPAPAFMAQYLPNDIVQGTVTRLFWDAEKTKTVAFVNIDNKFEARCTMKGGVTRIPIVGDKVDVLIVDADIDLEKNTGKMWGIITHIRSEFAYD